MLSVWKPTSTNNSKLLGSAYFLGASTQLLKELYDHETSLLVPIDSTFIRGEQLSKKNWRDSFNQKPCVDLLNSTLSLLKLHSYTVAYVDFFDREVEKNGGDWAKVLQEYLYDEPAPIINGFSGGRKS